MSVSYTHLDVYKRQDYKMFLEKNRDRIEKDFEDFSRELPGKDVYKRQVLMWQL